MNSCIDNRAAALKTCAAEIMTRNPISVCEHATVREAAVFLTARGFSAAPVIDAAGRPIGVLSRADIVRHVRNDRPHSGDSSLTAVRDIMSSDMLFVRPDTSLEEIVDTLLGQKIHRLFVVDSDGVLIGVISTFDVLRHFQSPRLIEDSDNPGLGEVRYDELSAEALV
jgi:CBS domain-containing protein